MDGRMVRLKSLELKHIKNVSYGKMELPCACRKRPGFGAPEILGLYGQNGSGKTAAIDALYFLQGIMTGNPLDGSLCDYMDANKDHGEISAEFAIFVNDIRFQVGYSVQLQRSHKKGVRIVREILSCAKNTGEKRKNRTVFMDYTREGDHGILKPRKRLDQLVGSNKECRTDLLVARKIAERSNCSYIFGESSREIFFREYENDFRDCSFIIQSLFHFAAEDLFVIRNTHSGVISANFVLPMAFRIESGCRNGAGMKGDFTVSLAEPTILDKEHRTILKQIVSEINMVLNTIIPGMTMDILDYGSQMMDDGNTGYKIELLSVREGIPPIPIRMESEGIIKIISILNALIQAFGNGSVCLAIDELDAGIYEYMLGELLDIFNKSAKGQLIFTSHNLRPLEMLDKDSIMFSTTNPENRYIHMKHIKSSNNLRDVYLRSITLGGQNEVIYDETDSLRIARAFRKAGRSGENGKEGYSFHRGRSE